MINYHISFAINFIYRLDGLIFICLRTPTKVNDIAEKGLENDLSVYKRKKKHTFNSRANGKYVR